MRVIKNSHNGIGGIAIEGIEMLKYVKSTPHNFLTLIHRDVNHLQYSASNSPNTSTHYLLVTKNSAELKEGVRNMEDLYSKYEDQISLIERIIEKEESDIAFCSGSFYYPWLLMQASKNKELPISVRYAGIIEKEEKEQLWIDMGKDFINKDYIYLFPSEHAKNELEKIHGVSLPYAYISPNGINSSFFNNESKKVNSKEFNIAFVGRLAPIKNPEYLAILASALRKEGVEANLFGLTDLSSVGNSPYQRSVLNAWREEGIKLIDFIDHNNLAEFYRSCNLIITPSHFETFGNVPLEAIASGTPAIINKNVGVKEAFYKLGLSDLVLDFNDLDSVIRKVKEIKTEKRVTSKKVVEKIARDYNWSAIIERNFSIMEEHLKVRQAKETQLRLMT